MTMIAYGGIRPLRPRSGASRLVLCAAAVIALVATAQAQTAPQPITPDRAAPVSPAQQQPAPAQQAAPASRRHSRSRLRRVRSRRTAFSTRSAAGGTRASPISRRTWTSSTPNGASLASSPTPNGASSVSRPVRRSRTPATRSPRFPTRAIVEGRQRCEIAPNGSPDCNAAADRDLQGQGFCRRQERRHPVRRANARRAPGCPARRPRANARPRRS